MARRNGQTTEARPRTGPILRPNVMPAGRLHLADLRRAAQENPKEWAGTLDKAIAEEHLSWRSVVDLRALWAALADVQVPVDRIGPDGQVRAVMASAFPVLCGGLTVAGINDAYMGVATIGQELVTEMEDDKRVSFIASVLTQGPSNDRVEEAGLFPEIGAGDERYEIRSHKNGRKLSVTREAIQENDVGNIVARINALGEIMAEYVEKLTLRKVCDVWGSATSPGEDYVLRLNGSGTALYSTSANAPGTRAPSGTRVASNPLNSTTALENARIRHNTFTNSRGEKIAKPMAGMKLLVPDALLPTALKLLGSMLEPGVENETNNWGPQGEFRPQLVTSPKLDSISTTAWYLGDFQKQFIRKWKMRMEYVELGENTQAYLDRQIAFQARIAWDVDIGAVDYVHVVQNLSGTTAPTAPAVGS